jgi:hypothetical protein
MGRAAVIGLGLSAIAVLGIMVGGCASPGPGRPAPVSTELPVVQPSTVTATPSVVVIQPPVTVVQPPLTVVRPQAPVLTSCRRLYADGYTFAYAYDEWVRAGYPANWDADHDGLPCEQSYGERN